MIAKADYEFLCQLLLERSGLSLGTGKEYLLAARLVPLAQSWGLQDLAELVRELRRTPSQPQLLSAVVEAMTTNETLFFRDKTPFDELRDRLLPPLIAARSSIRRLRIWCAAASTGQEPYSLAILLREHFPELSDWLIEILGTDLSQAALERAAAGVYSQFEVQRGLPIQLLMKYFQQEPAGWRIADDVRRCVAYRRLNLLEPFQHLGQFDLILCRNVLIYFENDLKKQILDRMAPLVRPDGCLILGAAETALGVTERFERLGGCRSAVFQPRAAASAPKVLSVVAATSRV